MEGEENVKKIAGAGILTCLIGTSLAQPSAVSVVAESGSSLTNIGSVSISDDG